MATDPKKPNVKSTKPVPAGLKKVGSNTMQKAKSFMQEKKSGPNKITAPSKGKAGGLKMGSASGTTPGDNQKTKTTARNMGTSTMKNLGSNNATVTTKGGRTELNTYYQGKDKSGASVTVPNRTFAGKTTAQVDSIANTMGVPKGGFKKVTTSTYRSNESMKTPKGTVTLKTAKVTAKKK